MELEATTAIGHGAQSNDQVGKFVEFYIGEIWTPPQLFFTGTARGETMKKRFMAVEGATKIRLSIDNIDAWGFWRIKFGGVTIHEFVGGAGATPPGDVTLNGIGLNGAGFWLDGYHVDGQEGPASIELDISSTFCWHLSTASSLPLHDAIANVSSYH
jgi:hypothetical protein